MLIRNRISPIYPRRYSHRLRNMVETVNCPALIASHNDDCFPYTCRRVFHKLDFISLPFSLDLRYIKLALADQRINDVIIADRTANNGRTIHGRTFQILQFVHNLGGRAAVCHKCDILRKRFRHKAQAVVVIAFPVHINGNCLAGRCNHKFLLRRTLRSCRRLTAGCRRENSGGRGRYTACILYGQTADSLGAAALFRIGGNRSRTRFFSRHYSFSIHSSNRLFRCLVCNFLNRCFSR